MIKSEIIDGKGTGDGAWIKDHALLVTQHTCPPLIPQKNVIFRQFLTDDGTSSGTSSMLVAAESVPTDFYIQASSTADRYITQVSFVIGDGGAALNQFGGITALTNGCQFFYNSVYRGTVTIHGELKSNWDFLRMCCMNPPFGDAATAFKGLNVEGGSEAFAPVIDFTKIMPPYGLKLDMASHQRLTLRIMDRTDQIDVFNAVAYGFERFE